MTRHFRSSWDTFYWRVIIVVMSSFLFIWTLAVVLQEHADHYIGYDIHTLRPTDALVMSFIETVHSEDPGFPARELPVRKWIGPVVFVLIANPSPWHRRVIADQASLLQKLTGLQIKEGLPGDESATLTIHFVEGRQAYRDTILDYSSKDIDWGKDFENRSDCMAIVTSNERDEAISAVNIIPWTGRNSRTRRCLIEELTQSIGPGNNNATYRPSIYGSHFMAGELTINDKILVRALYDPRIKPGMTRNQTKPIAREIIEELVAGVKERGEEALYQR